MDVTILGSGSPIPDAERAGPSGLVRAGGATVLVDAGRGVLMRLAAAGSAVPQLNAVLLTHLHSDHTTDVNDVITTFWVMPMTLGRTLRIIGPPGTQTYVDRALDLLATDIGYRIDHHEDLTQGPAIEVTEVTDGVCFDEGGLRIVARLVDHGVVKPAVGYRFEADDSVGGGVACWSGDTVPCEGLDALAAGADVYVQTVLNRELVSAVPIQRFLDTMDYHSDIDQAAQTAARAGVRTFVINHPVPAPLPGTEGTWVDQAAQHFDGEIIFATDLLTVSTG